jgi:hypothetical protein
VQSRMPFSRAAGHPVPRRVLTSLASRRRDRFAALAIHQQREGGAAGSKAEDDNHRQRARGSSRRLQCHWLVEAKRDRRFGRHLDVMSARPNLRAHRVVSENTAQ